MPEPGVALLARGVAQPPAPFRVWPAAMAVLPVAAALLASGLILLAVGIDPLDYYGLVVSRGLLTARGLQETLTRTAPLLLLGSSLIVSFRAGLWNLGVDGQFLLGAVLTAAVAPAAAANLPLWLAWPLCMAVGAATAMIWALPPAVLRATQGVNEIITTLMMNFLGVSLANVLIKLVFTDPATSTPITRTLPVDERLPRLFGSTVGIGVPLALLLVIGTHLVMTRTAWGLRLRLLGANPAAAAHAGLAVARLTVASIVTSGGLAGLAGSVLVLGTLGNVRAEWNPAYGMATIPLVFLARLNGWAVIGLVFLFAMLSIGAQSAAIRLGVPRYYTFVLVGLLLLFLGLAEYLDARHRRRGV